MRCQDSAAESCHSQRSTSSGVQFYVWRLERRRELIFMYFWAVARRAAEVGQFAFPDRSRLFPVSVPGSFPWDLRETSVYRASFPDCSRVPRVACFVHLARYIH